MIKLIAIDLDGTLLNSNKQIPKKNISAIQAAIAKGIKIVICTGRPQSGVMPYIDELGLNENEMAILNNGSSIHNTKDWSLIENESLSNEELDILMDALDGYPEVQLTLTEQYRFLAIGDQPSELVAADARSVFDEAQALSLEEAKQIQVPIFQAMYMAEPSVLDKFQAYREAELATHFSVVRSQPYIFEAMPKGVTKASALKLLAKDLNLKSEEIMALGDAANDLEMLQFAGLSVAMGNASEEVKASAKEVTITNDEAGVAYAIEKFILSK